MVRFILKILLFIILGFILIVGATKYYSIKVERHNFENYHTESNLFSMPGNKKIDLLFMGISHARMFTRHKNHLRLEEILNKQILNIGRGAGLCGPSEEYIYLKYFFKKGNKTDKVIYIPTPPMMFSQYMSQSSSTYIEEPFKLDFFFLTLMNYGQNKKQKLYHYLRFKFNPRWKKIKPYSAEINETVLEKYDSASVKWGFSQAYPNGLDSVTFKKNKEIILKTVKLANENNAEMIFLFTPAMFGGWPGHKEVLEFLHEIKKEYNIKIYDYSEVCYNINYYRDHHHLNSNGVTWFTENYLKDIIGDNTRSINSYLLRK
jgi:hypothetical protein